MKSSLPILAALLFQAGTFPSISSAPAPIADPQHLRYVRALTLPANASGVACTILDAAVYAHTASPSADDLRVFRLDAHNKSREVPFVVSYSAAQPTDAQTATVRNVAVRNNTLSFDLDMPPRPYSQVDLQLAAHNFFATAEVAGSIPGAAPKRLGVFTLFDLTQQQLSRSTTLSLQESTFHQLHVVLHFRAVAGAPLPHLDPSIIQGAIVPASREAQTLYTVVASTSAITQQGASSVAQLRIPAHVPVERLQFILDPAYKSDLLRNITITADADSHQPDQPHEVIVGQISRVTRPADAATTTPAITASTLDVPAVIASNVHNPANVRIEIHNGSEPPLPLQAVQVQMRQRTLCFNAVPNATYTLRYGDNDLHASVYDLGDLASAPANPLTAKLEPEELNPGYIQRRVDSTYDQRNPNLFWIALLAVIAVLGSLMSRHATRQGRRR